MEVNVDIGAGGATSKSTIEQRGKGEKPEIYLDEELICSSEHYHPNRPQNQGREGLEDHEELKKEYVKKQSRALQTLLRRQEAAVRKIQRIKQDFVAKRRMTANGPRIAALKSGKTTYLTSTKKRE